MSSMKIYYGIIGGLSLLFSLSAGAADIQIKIQNAKAVGNFAVGIGSEVSVDSNDSIFLGTATQPDGKATYQLYLDKKEQKVLYMNSAHFRKNAKQQSVLNPFEQAGGTCTGYAIYDFLQQSHLAGFKGSGLLDSRLLDEKGRTTLLVDNINEYYLTPSHRYSIQGILNKYGKEMGFACRTYKTDTYEKAKSRILNQLNQGSPVIVAFNLGTEMYKSPFSLKMYDNPKTKMDERLWIPRKVGERNGGGHTIVAAGSFEVNGKTYLVMIDSDWSEPRIWDMESFLNDRTALDEVELTTCN